MILAGPKQVCLYDPAPVTLRDLGRNFYAKEDHIGKASRAEASISDLKDLNLNVIVEVATRNDIDYM